MKALLNPKLDYVFKKLFISDNEILIDLLNTVLELPEKRRITAVQIKNPIILPEEITDKYIILDILAIDNRQHKYDIEMQAQKYESYPERILFYLSKLYGEQLESGEQYDELKPSIGVHFLDFEQFPDCKDFRYHFALRDDRHPELRLSDGLAIFLFELPKIEKLIKEERWGDGMYEWLYFFNHAHEEGEEHMQSHYRNPAIKKAFTVLERLSADDETRYQAQVRERSLLYKTLELSAAEKKGREEGRREGREEGKEEGMLIGEIRVAQRVLKHPVSTENELAQKSLEELRKIWDTLETELNA